MFQDLKSCWQGAAMSVVLTIAAFGMNGLASEPNPELSRLNLSTDRVIVFKDGYCLVVKQGFAKTDQQGVVYTDDVPDSAILGSFWAVPERGTIKAMIAGWEHSRVEEQREVSCVNTIEIIKANLGKRCHFEQGGRKFSGTLSKILSNDDLPPLNRDLVRLQSRIRSASHPAPTTNPLEVIHSQVTGQHFLLNTEVGDVMIATSSIKNLTIENMSSVRVRKTTEVKRHKRLSLKFAERNAEVKISLMYFRPDVRWIPTYRVNLTDDEYVMDHDAGALESEAKVKSAEIIMQGEILNEAEDFEDVPFHVVVGVPNFRFRTIPSPMILESSLRNALAQAAPNIMGNGAGQFSNALYTQRSGEFRSHRASGSEARAEVEIPKELTGSGGNDLYVYQLDKMSLKKGERALIPILRTKVPYRDIYTWDIQLTHAETYSPGTSAESPSPLVLSQNKIWRQVELMNDTDIPWTTGAAMFVDGFQPLAQELLTYTSPGGICRVPVTVSVDLRGKIVDRETNRELKALVWRNSDYARVDGKVEVEMANNKSDSVEVEVRLRFGGKAKNVSDDGEKLLHPYRAEDWLHQRGDHVNNSSQVSWKATVKPGECFKPVVDYEFFLRY